MNTQSTAGAGNAGFSGDATDAGPVAGFDPVLVSLIRRSMPNLMAYDICGVQPMNGPTGLIFAMRSSTKVRNHLTRHSTTKLIPPSLVVLRVAMLATGLVLITADRGLAVGLGTTPGGQRWF